MNFLFLLANKSLLNISNFLFVIIIVLLILFIVYFVKNKLKHNNKSIKNQIDYSNIENKINYYYESFKHERMKRHLYDYGWELEVPKYKEEYPHKPIGKRKLLIDLNIEYNAYDYAYKFLLRKIKDNVHKDLNKLNKYSYMSFLNEYYNKLSIKEALIKIKDEDEVEDLELWEEYYKEAEKNLQEFIEENI